jgi:hypothetical protein
MSLPSTHTDNTPTPAPAATVGFKLSKPGFDANTAAGANLVFDSSWPSLPIAFDVTIDNPITGFSSRQVIPHKLGFAPFGMGWAYSNDASGINNVGSRFPLMTDTKNIYLSGAQENGPPTYATKLKLRCFQLDLGTDIDYSLAPGDTFNYPYDNNYGVKLVLPNKSISSTDMRDFALHSRCQSPLILAVKTEKTLVAANIITGGSVVQYTNKLAYPVWFYGFIKMGSFNASNVGAVAGAYLPAPYYSQAYPRIFTDGFIAYIEYLTGGSFNDEGATIVVLRDPMFAAKKVTIQY